MTYSGPLCLDLIERGAAVNSDRIAVVFDGEELSFAQVNSQANRLGNAMQSLDAGPGTRIALLVNNGLLSIPLDFACVKAGINRVPLNARLSLDEQARMIAEADCQFLIFGADLSDRAADLVKKMPGLKAYGLGARLQNGDDLLSLSEPESETPPQYDAKAEDIILTLYTSGTTGVLKAAQHTQASYAAICRNILLNLFPVTETDRMLHAASMIHASGTFVLPFWIRGACSLILPGFEPGAFLKSVETYRPTAINLVPTMMQMLLEHDALTQSDLSSLKHIIYGASPMPRSVIKRAIAHFGQEKFWQYFGQTEAPLCLAVLRPEDHVEDLLGACGRPALEVEIQLVDEQGEPVENGQAGEILVRTPSSAAGYFKSPELSAKSFDADGWVHTRDVGVFDDRGYLHLRDRTSDMIISGGYNIYPREVEDALMSHSSVLEAAVVGAPHEKWVEAVTAFVVLRSERQAEEKDLISHVASQIASYKKPHRIVFVDSLPKTPVGKLDRKTLRHKLAG